MTTAETIALSFIALISMPILLVLALWSGGRRGSEGRHR